jgi:hypothetical protein
MLAEAVQACRPLMPLVAWCGQISKEKRCAHVILSTSDYAFSTWLTKGEA